jgi:hypothetical protein
MKKIKITNVSESPIQFRFGGQDYEIPAKGFLLLSPEVSAHAFGIVLKGDKLELDKELFAKAALRSGYGWYFTKDPVTQKDRYVPDRFDEFRKLFKASLVDVKEVETVAA